MNCLKIHLSQCGRSSKYPRRGLFYRPCENRSNFGHSSLSNPNRYWLLSLSGSVMFCNIYLAPAIQNSYSTFMPLSVSKKMHFNSEYEAG